MNLKDLIKVAAPVALNYFAPGIGQALLPGVNPFLQKALVSGVGSIALGGKPKDAVISGIMGGLGGQFLDGRQAAMQQGLGDSSKLANLNQSAMEQAAGLTKNQTLPGGSGFGAFKGSAPLAESKTLSGDLLQSLELAGEDKGNLLFKIMNSKIGEGLAAGLIAQLLAGDEEDAPQGEFERRPFGAGGPGGRIGGMPLQYADGGEAYFPRRNGGIDPSEGSGTKDDVPALLLAGEFVHTRDANEGLGKMMGAKNKDEAARMGIEAQYKLMNAFERMA